MNVQNLINNSQEIKNLKNALKDLQEGALAHHKELINEGGFGYNPHEATEQKLIREINEAELNLMANNFAEIREAWNKRVQALPGFKSGKVSMSAVAEIAKDMGLQGVSEMQKIKARAIELGVVAA